MTERPTLDENLELISMIQAGDRSAEDKFIRLNIGLVYFELKSLGFSDQQRESAESYGLEGLMLAARRFDQSLGNKFSTFAFHYIRGLILSGMKDEDGIIRTPRYCWFDNSPEHIRVAFKKARSIKSIETDANDEPEPESYVNPDDFDPDEASWDASLLNDALASLPGRERQILQTRYGLNGTAQMTLKEISDVLGISRERVRQLQDKAIEKLKRWCPALNWPGGPNERRNLAEQAGPFVQGH